MLGKNPSTSKLTQKDNCIHVMIGNPGTGKSTILNAILGKVAFKSGVSLEKGLTTILQEEFDEKGNSYIDTPGLSDIKMREKAAQEIKKALTKEGNFKIFFVITLESGRIRPDDKTTMKLVLEAAPEIGKNCYSIIINKVQKEVSELMEVDKEGFNDFLQDLNDGLPGTNRVCLIEYQEELESKQDTRMRLSFKFKRFLNEEAPLLELKKERVRDINIQGFEEILGNVTSISENNKILQEQLLQQKKMQREEELKRQKTRDDFYRKLEEERRQQEKLAKELEIQREEARRLEELKRRRQQEEEMAMRMLFGGHFVTSEIYPRHTTYSPYYGGGNYGGGNSDREMEREVKAIMKEYAFLKSRGFR